MGYGASLDLPWVKSPEARCVCLGFKRCSPANNPPTGYNYGMWDVLDQMKAKIVDNHGYNEEEHETYVVLHTVYGPRSRRKRAIFKKRPGVG